ncbi:MAG: pilus assembly protein MshP [Gammaproteobacteria bacterium]|nr:pilus assembly protein MshP [Gammaproteobacteria bacterium]
MIGCAPITNVRQRGFTLVAAIFVLVITAMLGTFMVTLSVVQHSTVSMAVQGARGYQAASSGVEWGIYRAVSTGACPVTTTFAVASSFSVTVSCTESSHVEPQSDPGTFKVFVITGNASAGSYDTADYISRSAEATVTNANPP